MTKQSNNSLDAVFIITEGFNPLDLFGPIAAWTEAAASVGRPFRHQIMSLQQTHVVSDTGVAVMADRPFDQAVYARHIILPGGAGMRQTQLNSQQLEWLNLMCDKAQGVASVCTGAFVLAQLDCADQRQLTTHWKHSEALRNQHPNVHVSDRQLYIQDRNIWSSGGVTAGIDMSLAMISLAYGRAIATAVAREMLVYLHRPGNQSQYSTPLQVQSFNDQRFIDLLAWVQENLDQQLTLQQLAEQANYSPRHLSRLFKQKFHRSPSDMITRLRMDRARVLLAEGGGRISEIARAVGYSHLSSFRRVFAKHFELSPQAYRQSMRTHNNIR